MSDATAESVEEPPKASKMPLILGLVAALLGGGGGFYATFSGLLFAPEVAAVEAEVEVELAPLPDVDYIAIEPLIISIGPLQQARHLRFHAQLEVPKKYKEDVEAVLPRIIDVINGYLRAVKLQDLEDNLALLRFRSHLLRRIDIVTGNGRVNDLLIMEFVVN